MRIITLGDSFTFGVNVNTEDNWTERLEDMFNNNSLCPNISKYEVINLGVGGFDVPYIVKRFKEIGMKYNPDFIIWFESGSGIRRYNEFLQPLIQQCVKEIKTRAEDRLEINVKIRECWLISEKKMYEIYSPKLIQNYLNKQMSQFFLLRKNIPVLFVTFSNLPTEDKEILRTRLKNQPKVYFTDSIRDLGPDSRLFDYHPNKKGHQMIAEDLFKYLSNTKIVPCRTN